MFFEASTLASLAAVMAQALEAYGCDSEAILRRAGLDTAQLSTPGWRYPRSNMFRLWRLAEEATGDPTFGLRVGASVKPAHLHALGLAWEASVSIADGLERLVRYNDVLTTDDVLGLVGEPERYVFLIKEPRVPVPFMTIHIDAALATVVTLCRAQRGASFAPAGVEIARSMPMNIDAYVSALGRKPKFGAERNALTFGPEITEPLSTGNPQLASEIDAIAQRYASSFADSLLVQQVRLVLVGMLPTGNASIDAVARRMHTSVSTLRRRLRAEGAAYRDLLEDSRRDLAVRYVREEKFSLTEIAFLLGFADQSSLTRAFRRWTGLPPGRFRSDAADGESGETAP